MQRIHLWWGMLKVVSLQSLSKETTVVKFLIINRDFGTNADPLATKSGVKDHVDQLKAHIKDGTIEVAYAFPQGGCAYVVNSIDTEDLTKKIRFYPGFQWNQTEVIPIADAVDFLERFANYMSG